MKRQGENKMIFRLYLNVFFFVGSSGDFLYSVFITHQKEDFQKYIPYFKDRTLANYLLSLDEPRKFLKVRTKICNFHNPDL